MNTDRKNTILLADPDCVGAEGLADRLNGVGFNVLIANDADMALKLLLISNADIILLDILMQGTDGQDLLTEIKANSLSNDIPLIILSADTDINLKIYGFLSGANDYMAKPYVFPEVLARINTQLRISHMKKELEAKNKELVEKNVLLQQMAITDALTGLFNRGYIQIRLSGEILHAARYKESISFIMVDIDHFKRINDTFGHPAGDKLLKEVANHIKEAVRDADIAIRYGGEEFLIVCPNTDVLGAVTLADRIRERIEKALYKLGSNEVHITASLGIRSAIPKTKSEPEVESNRLIADADIALYMAKSNGRNCVEVYNGSEGLGLKRGKLIEHGGVHADHQMFDSYRH